MRASLLVVIMKVKMLINSSHQRITVSQSDSRDENNKISLSVAWNHYLLPSTCTSSAERALGGTN